MIKLEIFKQEKPGFCGPAALRMVFNYYGLKLSENKVAKASNSKKALGTLPRNLIGAVRSFGWHGFWKEMGTFDDLKFFVNQSRPVVVDWFSIDDGHYSVVIGFDKKFIYLADPEFIRPRKMSWEYFENVWFDFEGPDVKHPKKWHFRWLAVPSRRPVKKKIKGHYF